MKRLIGWPAAWLLYWLGDLVWRVMRLGGPLYHQLMIASIDVQDWAGLDSPWRSGD